MAVKRRTLTHVDASGAARMVGVGHKDVTTRAALARTTVVMRRETLELLRDGRTPKGDVLAACRLAGILAAKRTPELIPLCHAIALTKVEVDIDLGVGLRPAAEGGDEGRVVIHARAEARDRTGVEMEALVAASVAALTLYDMLKAVDRGMTIAETCLVEKRGGRSGDFAREATSTAQSKTKSKANRS